MVHIDFPSGELANFIDTIVYSEYNPSHSIERLIPDGSVNLIIELGDVPQYLHDNGDLSIKEKYTGAWFSGIQQGYISISAQSSAGMMVVRFRPTGAYTILHLPLDELNNKVIDASLILGNEIIDLREQLMENPNVEGKLAIIKSWLTSRIEQAGIPQTVVNYAVWETITNPSEATIQRIMEKTGYSHRHLIALFKKYVGITPKQYHRILRFNHCLEKIDQGKKLDWATLSAQCGYYDQSHFIKEFRTFSGFNPQEFLRERGEYIHYIPVG